MTWQRWLQACMANLFGTFLGLTLAIVAAVFGLAASGTNATQPNESNMPFRKAQTEVLYHRLEAWRPTSSSGVSVSLGESKGSAAQLPPRCSRGVQFTGNTKSFSVRLVVVSCESSWAAYDITDNYAGDVIRFKFTGGENTIRVRESSGSGQAVWRFRGTAFALLANCSNGLDCRDEVPSLVRQVVRQLQDLPLADPPLTHATRNVLVVPATMWLLVILPLRIIRRFRQPRYSSVSAPPQYEDLTHDIRSLNRRRVTRNWATRVAWILLVLGIGSWGVGVFTPSVSAAVQGAMGVGLAIGGFVIARRFAPQDAQRWSSNAGATGWRAAWGWLSTTSATVLSVALLVYFVLIAVGTSLTPPGGKDAFYYAMRAPSGGPVRTFVSQAMATTLLGAQGGSSLVYLLAILPFLLVAAGLNNLGQRLRAADLQTAIQADTSRPSILYLRAFDEDKLRVAAPALKRTIAQRLLARRTRRFEEVLAWSLSAYGPVVATSPSRRLAPLGAAKTHLPREGWNTEVEKLVGESLVVVVSGTPRVVRDGLRTELKFLAAHPSLRLLVVQAPWRPKRLVEGWTVFCEAVACYPVFEPITRDWVQPGTLVLAHMDSGPDGWYAWGATTRTDRSYEVAVRRAMERGLPRWSAELAAVQGATHSEV